MIYHEINHVFACYHRSCEGNLRLTKLEAPSEFNADFFSVEMGSSTHFTETTHSRLLNQRSRLKLSTHLNNVNQKKRRSSRAFRYLDSFIAQGQFLDPFLSVGGSKGTRELTLEISIDFTQGSNSGDSRARKRGCL